MTMIMTINTDWKTNTVMRINFENLKMFVTTEIPEVYPKYDPCRKFKKGDIVRLKAYNGRKPYDFWHKQTIEHFGAKPDTVLADELESGNVDIFQDAPIDELTVRVHASYLELVTPVEELEPYYVEDVGHAWVVRKPEPSDMYSTQAWFSKKRHPHAKEAAEAECARLNAEWRKENSHE